MKRYKNYIIIILLLIVILFSLNYFKNQKDDNIIEENYHLEKNYSNFFTVNSCIYKYIEFLSNKDSKSIIEVLNQDFVKENNITEDNVYSFVKNIDGMYSFTARKMYKFEYENISKYYVYGHLIKNDITGTTFKEDNYYFVILDKDNTTFSIKEISKSDYLEVANE